eukprot:EG_transcript_22742
MSIMQYNGGAVMAMIGKECVALASDMRFGQQFNTIATTRPKVHEVTDKCYVGLAGLATDTQTLLEKLKFRTNLYKLREERDISPKALAALLSSMLYERRFGPWFVEPIVAGLDENNQPYVHGMDLIGAGTVPDDFVVAGTCDESMLGACESLWRKDLSPEELFETISQAMLSSLDRDCISGWGCTVVVITKDRVITRELKARMD